MGHYERTALGGKFVTKGAAKAAVTRFLTEFESLLSPSDSTTDMAQTVVRCPYCVLGVQFRPMSPHLDGRFICEQCGHISLADGTSFKCSCYRCGELNALRINRDVNPILKIKTVAS
jgi:hypothetical protein